MTVVLLFALAGALVGAGAGGAWYTAETAKREAAARLARKDREALRKALAEEISLAELRDQARAAGIDPKQVEEGYKAIRDGRMTPEDLIRQILPE